MRTTGTSRPRMALLSLAVAALAAAQTAHSQVPNAAGKPASQMDVFDRAETEKLLNVELQRVVDAQPKLPGQKRIEITTHLSLKVRRLLIDLGRDAVPNKSGAASERQCHELSTEALSILNGAVSVNGFTCTYGGKDIFYYHPDPPAMKQQ